MRVGAATSIGRVRDHNEDAFWISENDFAVCDGMGGHQAGEVASSLAIDVFKNYCFTNQRPLEAVVDAILSAHRVVQAEAAAPDYSGMGTTATLAYIVKYNQCYELFIGHVGDSRAYLLHNDTLEQITSDHSLVGELIRNGSLSKSDAVNHPHRHVVTQALGIGEIKIETHSKQLVSNDQILLCTDGLTDVVEESMIQDTLRNHAPEAAAQKLVEMANEMGGPDNITVIVVKIP